MPRNKVLPSDTRPVVLRRRWGKAIKRQRGAMKMSQQQLADAVGVTQQAVAHWEIGLVAPRPHHQASIARALGVEWAVLFQPDAA